MSDPTSLVATWPALPYESWQDTCVTLNRYLQIVGKLRLAQTPWINHSWHVTLYVTSRGLTTSPIPFGERSFQIDLDFVAHRLVITTSDGRTGGFALEPRSVAAFHRRLKQELRALGIRVAIVASPNEVPDAIAFAQDEVNRSYDAEAVHRFWQILVHSHRVLTQFRAGFAGKCSPVHFFWGGSDLAVTRFSGRAAPEHPGGIPNLPDWVTREAYSSEVSSCGFWAGGDPYPHACFYAYAYPEPAGFATSKVGPRAAFYHQDLHEFLLPYDEVRESTSPDTTLVEFLESTYAAAADLAHWDRAALERPAAAFPPRAAGQ